MPYGQARRLPAPGVPSTDRLNLYPTPIADGTVVWTARKTDAPSDSHAAPPTPNPEVRRWPPCRKSKAANVLLTENLK